MTAKKPGDPDLAALVNQVKAELRADLAEGLRRGGAAIATQVNECLATTNTRLSRLEQRASPPNRKR
jgi:hypothetical protein